MEERPASVGEQFVTAEDIERLSDPSPVFRAWVREAYVAGRLDTIVQATMATGRATDVWSALDWLNQLSHQMSNGQRHVAVRDYEGRGLTNHRFRELQTLVSGETRPACANIALRHGMISHGAIHDLFSGQLAGQPTDISPRSLPIDQVAMFETAEAAEPDNSETVSPTEPNEPTGCWRRRLRTIANRWTTIAPSVAREADLFGQDWTGWRRKQGRVQTLLGLVNNLFSQPADRLRSLNGHYPNLDVLTLLSWASAVAHYVNSDCSRPRLLYREVPVIAAQQHISGGRIDALEVRLIDSRVPNSRQRHALECLRGARIKSSGALIGQLRTRLHQPLELAIIDWKFLIGDVFTSHQENELPDLTSGPLPAHRRQLRRYLTLVPFDLALSSGSENIWQPSGITLIGEIWYFLPHQPPIIHRIDMTPTELEQRFMEQIVRGWRQATQRADVRQLNNLITGQLLGANDSPGGRLPRAQSIAAGLQDSLFANGNCVSPAHSIVEEHRRRLHQPVPGTFNILTTTAGQDGRSGYEMNYGQLLASIEAGDLEVTRHFDPLRGGKINCLFPDHDDPTPSMHLYLDRWPPRFFCFGCELGGLIPPDTIPHELAAQFAQVWRKIEQGRQIWRQKRHKAYVTIADEQHPQIMKAAQALLAGAFRRSRAEEYIAQVRRIDPDLAASYNAGFGSLDHINGLLDAGYSFDELVRYGFISFGPRVPADSPLVRLLLQRGLSLNELSQQMYVKGKSEPTTGLAYAMLNGRLTFPLVVDGITNSFYGRAIWPCPRPASHRKLKVDGGRIIHGAFNQAVLESSRHQEVIVCEGALDALTLIQLGHTNALAMIGVANIAVAMAVAHSGKAVAIALDWDKAGIEKTAKLEAMLRQDCGYQGPVRNFTQQWLTEHTLPEPGPDGKTCKDFNEWLIRQAV